MGLLDRDVGLKPVFTLAIVSIRLELVEGMVEGRLDYLCEPFAISIQRILGPESMLISPTIPFVARRSAIDAVDRRVVVLNWQALL